VTRPGPCSLEDTLRQADGLVRAARALSVSLAELPAIDLPAPSAASIDQAQLRAVAVLYLASELEDAGVVAAAEQVMRLARSGGLTVDLGAATPLLQKFWLSRNERSSAGERQSFFGGLFGYAAGPDLAGQAPNRHFEDRMIDLCEALYKIDEQGAAVSWGGVEQQARVRTTAQRLLEVIERGTSGITVFLAGDILGTLKDALAILTHPAVLAAFGSRTLGQVVVSIHRRLRLPAVTGFDEHRRRGQSGMTIVSWLAGGVACSHGAAGRCGFAAGVAIWRWV
jgi:hypothetical protein